MKLSSLCSGILIAATLASLSSCSSKDDIEGTWTGTPQKMAAAGSDGVTGPLVNSRVITTLTFTPESNDSIDGTVQFSSTVSAQDEINENNGVSLDVPYEVSVSAITTATGTYKFVDDDDIAIFLDANSIEVSMDPEAVKFTSNVADGRQHPEIENLRTGQFWRFKTDILSNMRQEYLRYHRLSDVKVKDNILSVENDDHDYSFRRAGEEGPPPANKSQRRP